MESGAPSRPLSRIGESALACLGAGLSVLPAHPAEKRPELSGWKAFQGSLPTERQVLSWFADAGALCIVTGKVSGRLEMIDFDGQGVLFDAWRERVRSEAPGLLERLVVEKSPSGGRHAVYRCEADVSGNLKLAQRRMAVPGPEEVVFYGKPYKPRKEGDGGWAVLLTLIETRGEGGLFLCAPSPGYELTQGDFTRLAVLTSGEREILLEAAWSLNEHWPGAVDPGPAPMGVGEGLRPGDDFNARGDVRAVLLRHEWALARGGENEYWRRPGKDRGWSATLKDGVFYVFSSSASPFEPNQAYSPFAVYALLDHGGDYARAASALRTEGYGRELPAADVDLSRLIPEAPGEERPPELPDPGPLPPELLRIPGFVSELMDHCLETAPYPNPVMAFGGALAFQAFLAGRKIRDSGDNRTNLYVLGLAHSAAGKDWPRKINLRLAHEVGLAGALGDRFASGEGVQDALLLEPTMLFQTDEIDGLLQSVNKSRDARHESVLGTLLTMYSSAGSVYPMRRKAGQESATTIDQPCLVLFGTAIPNHYYEALSERMLTNGFFARMLILEGGPRPKGQEARIPDLPARLLKTARWWADFRPGRGNLEEWHPVPRVVEHTGAALQVLAEARGEAEEEYAKAEARGDPVGTTVWGRVDEQARKLALLYAASAGHQKPEITEAAARWAAAVVQHQTRRMLFMAEGHVAENPFQADCLRLLRKLREAPGRQISHSVLLKRMKVDAKAFHELVVTLEQRCEIQVCNTPRAGTAHKAYRLVNVGGEGVKGGKGNEAVPGVK